MISEGIGSAKREQILPRQQLCLQQGLLVPEMEERPGVGTKRQMGLQQFRDLQKTCSLARGI